jgi:hypothetical protein
MAFDVDKLIADAKAARAAAEVQKAEADKVAAALKASKKANQSTRLQVDDRLNYANALSQTLSDIEAKLVGYGTRIGRGDKLGPGEQKEFDILVSQYESVNTNYKKTIKQVDSILAKAPSPTGVEVKGGKAQIAPTKEEVAATGKTPAAQTPVGKPEDFAGMLTTATKFIKDMSGPERKILAQSLNDSLNLKLPVSELVDPGSLLAAYKGAIAGAQARYNQFGDVLSVDQFLTQKKLENSVIQSAGGGAFGNIYDPTQAKALINSVITSVLGREATAKEISNLTAKLVDAQAKNPYKKNAQGMTVGGLNAEQFITDLVKATPEYSTKQQAKQDITAQNIASVARANGLNLRPDEIKTYADRVKNGEDIKIIENQLRTVASLGQPDTIKKLMADGTDLETIYAPYKRTLATSLGLNPESITLDDPTLRMAIGPDKEMSLYDYKKAIRNDSRWKYSEEANNEVSNMINQVKRDFGFMG